MYGAALSFLIAKVCIVVIVVILCRNYNEGMFDIVGMIRTILPSICLIGVGLIFSYTKYETVFNWSNFLYKCGILGGYLVILLIHYKSIIYTIVEQWRNKKQK